MARASAVTLVLALVGCGYELQYASQLRKPVEAICIAKGEEIVAKYPTREEAQAEYDKLKAWCDTALYTFDAIDGF